MFANCQFSGNTAARNGGAMANHSARLSVMLSWLWTYATYHRSARLITGEVAPPRGQLPLPQQRERKCA